MPAPLRPDARRSGQQQDVGPDTPEALLISAMLESGTFDPTPFHLTADHLTCWQQLWKFGVDYQERAGEGPPMTLVEQRFPDFILTPGINPRYAAHQVHQAHDERQLRERLGAAAVAVGDGDLETAFAEIDKIERPRMLRRPAIGGFDHTNVTDDFDEQRIPVPFHTLGRVSGGIGPAELWYWAARPSHGKTYLACLFVKEAVKHGYHVRYVSAEMPSRRINLRIARVLTNGDQRMLTMLASKDPAERKKVMDELKERTLGSWETVDPSHGKITNGFIREQMHESELVVVDHMGLIRTNAGHRAIDDWRAQATVSNQLREDNLATGTPVFALSQIARKGESSSNRAPKGSDIAGSDALLQDGVVVVTMKRLSKHTMVYSAEKVRENDTPVWWGRYDPARVRFEELTKDRAMEIVSTDEDFEDLD